VFILVLDYFISLELNMSMVSENNNFNISPKSDVNDVQKLLDEIRKTSEIARKLLEESKTDFNDEKENIYLDSLIKKPLNQYEQNNEISPLKESNNENINNIIPYTPNADENE
jgi:hypothetical protein